MNTDHLADLRHHIRAMETQAPMAPWRRSGSCAVGGLEMVGYGDNSDFILILSSSGRGVFDAINGWKVARDLETYNEDESWFDFTRLQCLGIGPLEGQVVTMAGLWGGGLVRVSDDGFALQAVAPTWPDFRVLLSPPRANIHNHLDQCVQVEEDYEIRAFGFSPTGKSFLVALNHTLYTFIRD
ncbi:hypothetical protein IAD21_03335 [Abditibacteriota bacterium]|nr:hypothetical protein IAD21_03335 [Abditibacteriota bacterium]